MQAFAPETICSSGLEQVIFPYNRLFRRFDGVRKDMLIKPKKMLGFFHERWRALVFRRQVMELFNGLLPGGNEFIFAVIGQTLEINGILAEFDFYITVVTAVNFDFAVFATEISPIDQIRYLEGQSDFNQILILVVLKIQLFDHAHFVFRLEIIEQQGVPGQIKQANREQHYGRQSFQRLVLYPQYKENFNVRTS